MIEEVLVMLAAVAAVLAVELDNLYYSILSFIAACIAVSALVYLAGAPLVAMFLSITYAGAMSIFMLVVLHSGEEHEK